MNLQEILSFLNPVRAFKQIITFFHSRKAPRGIHQKAILQITFGYCGDQECFNKFRLVCKSWKHAAETKRFDKMVGVGSTFPILNYERNGKFKVFVPKYLKIFRGLKLTIDSQILMKWDSITKLILQNMKNLHRIDFYLEADIYLDDIPQNFDAFALHLFQKSQSTLKTLVFCGYQILQLPLISLPNVTIVHISIDVDDADDYHDYYTSEEIERFTNFVQRILENCEYLERFFIYGINDLIQMIEYFEQNYPDSCLHSFTSFDLSRKLPTTTSYCPSLSSLPTFKYPSSKKCLNLQVNDFNHPFEESWGDYKSIFALFSNLQKIRMFEKFEDTEIELEEALQNISPENQDIWKERIQYLKSWGIEIVNHKQFINACKQLHKQNKLPSIAFFSV